MKSYPLDHAVHFLGEQRTELYEKYCSGVAQAKNVLDAKNALQRHALLVLERHGV